MISNTCVILQHLLDSCLRINPFMFIKMGKQPSFYHFHHKILRTTAMLAEQRGTNTKFFSQQNHKQINDFPDFLCH